MKLSDDAIHELLNAGLGEAKAEVLAVLDSEERLDRQTVIALSGVEGAGKHLKWLLRYGLARRHKTATTAVYWLAPDALETATAIRRLPKGVKMQAENPEVRAAARANLERRMAARRAAKT